MKLIAPYKPEHPIVPLTKATAQAALRAYGPEEYNRRMRERNAAIKRSEDNPFEYVYQLPQWLLCDWLLGFITKEAFLADKRVPERWKRSEALIEFASQADLYVLLILGGNRSGKTEYMIWRAVQDLVKYPYITIWVMHQVERMSVKYHQERVFRYLPDAWKDAGKGKGGRDTTYISYNQQNGFSNGKLTGPEGQTMEFLYYTMDVKVAIEGGELGSPEVKGRVGYIADELMPLTWFKAMRARTSTRGSKGLIGFTPIDGYTDTVAEFQDGASTVYGELAAEDIIEVEKFRRVPVLRKCVDKGKAIVNFHTHYNPFEDFRAFKARHQYDTIEQKRIKFYGEATKAVSAAFPRYDERVHVVKREVIAHWKEPGIIDPTGGRGEKGSNLDIQRERQMSRNDPNGAQGMTPTNDPEEPNYGGFKFPGTNYLIVDPGKSGLEGKNWALGWVRVDAYNRYWIYREWPCEQVYVPNWGFPGPWAEPGSREQYKWDGIPGEGSKAMNFTIEDMKIEMARLEQWDDADRAGLATAKWDESEGSVDQVKLRYMDSRFANTPVQTHLENTTLIELCADVKLYFIPTFSAEGQGTIREGTQMVANGLGNPDDPNQPPQLFICEDCTNFQFAMKIWTGKDGAKGATKDWIDLLRYAYMAQLSYLEPTGAPMGNRGMGAYGSPGIKKMNPVAAAKKGRR